MFRIFKYKMDEDSAKVEFPPPLFTAICMLFSWFLHSIIPISINVSRPTANLLGFLLTALGFGLIISCAIIFKLKNTNLKPWKTTTIIIQNGPYSFSRNPIYLGMCMLQLAVSFFLRSFIGFFFLIILIGFLRFFVIQNEEDYLSSKFKDEYDQYCKQVNRWFTLKKNNRAA